MATFGERLKELMNEEQMTAAALAFKLNTAPSKICRWYNYDKDISLENLAKLSEIFQCSFEYLAGRIEVDTQYSYRQLPPFATRLRQLMDEVGATEYRMIKCGIFTPSMYYRWRKDSSPRLSSLIKIADYLQCTLDHLVGR